MSESGKICPVCGSQSAREFLQIDQVPVHCNLLWPTLGEAIQSPKGDIHLAYCERCGHIFNSAFEPARMEYTRRYENSLHFSPRFQSYATDLARHLVESYDLHGKDIIEIGCGRGDFLYLLCSLGNNRGLGFDPAAINRADSSSQQVTFIQGYYSEKYAHYPADLICSRQMLEHIKWPREFLEMLLRATGNRSGTIFFFEVPNVKFILHELSVWDIIYEHPSYFSRRSIIHLFRTCGYQILSVEEAFSGQFLTLLAKTGIIPDAHMMEIDVDQDQDVDSFVENYQQKMNVWMNSLDLLRRSGKRAVIWGAGSKGVTFLNLLKPGKEISYAVDINPHKHGMFMAGTGQQIVSPEFLRTYRPDWVILMNAIYEDETRRKVTSLGLEPEFMLV